MARPVWCEIHTTNLLLLTELLINNYYAELRYSVVIFQLQAYLQAAYYPDR